MAALSSRQRWLVWLLLLAGVLAAGAWIDDEGGDEPPAASKPSRPAPARDSRLAAKAPESTTRLELPQPAPPEPLDRPEPGARLDLFAARSWYVPPPPPPPPVPRAPPLPFKVVGRILDKAEPVVFLSHKDRNIVARAGMWIDQAYQVEAIEPTRMIFIYAPLQERQTLTLGAAR